jgi:hypothetical protein
VTPNLKGSNRTSLRLKGGTTHATYIRISLLHSKIGSYPSPKWPQIEGCNFLHHSAMSVVILCKVMKVIWFEEANFKLSGHINSHSCGVWDVTDTAFKHTRVFNWCALPYLCVLESILSWIDSNEWVIIGDAAIVYCTKTPTIACQQYQICTSACSSCILCSEWNISWQGIY